MSAQQRFEAALAELFQAMKEADSMTEPSHVDNTAPAVDNTAGALQAPDPAPTGPGASPDPSADGADAAPAEPAPPDPQPESAGVPEAIDLLGRAIAILQQL